jgi:hypothetical protein
MSARSGGDPVHSADLRRGSPLTWDELPILPFWRDDASKLCVDYVGEFGLPESDVNRILGGNGQQLLGL